MKKMIIAGAGVLLATSGYLYFNKNQSNENWLRPENQEAYEREEEEYDQEKIKAKLEDWSAEKAIWHQKQLKRVQHVFQNPPTKAAGGLEVFSTLRGTWHNRAPRNMPGAFKFAEMLDGTDTIYGVTHNHYSGEYNSKSYIFKGTVYNPTSGTTGDDFVRLTGHWPNRYKNLIAFKYNGRTRLIAGIENGPVYYSDDEGQNWSQSSGSPSLVYSTILNRQDGRVYTTDGYSVYVSLDGGATFSSLQNFGSYGDMTLYSPRYDVQPDAENVYLAREGAFYTLNGAKTAFTQNGNYTWSGHNNSSFSIGGDSRKLYVTVNKDYWVSTNGGTSWTQKYPNGNWYGDRTGDMDAGMFIAVSPENADHVMGGYAQPVISNDGLDSDVSTTSGWGSYQNGYGLSVAAYHDRLRFNYHPDFQAHHFFYNSSGNLFFVGCTDGGMFMSYKVWYDYPAEGSSYNSSSYSTAHWININILGTQCGLTYRDNIITGYKDDTHIVISTQDQGTQDLISSGTASEIDVYQTIGGDGPPFYSADGNWVWKWKRQGSQVWIPEELYDGSGNRRSIGTVNSLIGANSSVTFTENTSVGWVKVFADHDEPSKRLWTLGRDLNRAEVDASGTSISGTTISKGGTSHQVCAMTQAWTNPDVLYFLKEGVVYKSTNRGDSFDGGTSTPFTATSNKQNIGGGWVLPTDDNWILFAGPSGNNVGAVLSKDGGQNWIDVTGSLPSGDDYQVSGMVGTPDGQYVFAGTEVGPYVFVVAEETWYPMFGGEAAMFNTTSLIYHEATNTVRFGTWGSGVWDFVIDDGTPSLSVQTMSDSYSCDSLRVTWSTNVEDAATVKLLKNSVEVESWNVTDAQDLYFAWLIPDGYTLGSDYQVEVSAGGATSTSNTFSIGVNLESFDQNNLSIDYVDSEHSASRVASNTIDGDNSTFWHTEWSPGTPDFPHEIIYYSVSSENFAGFSYLPRQDGSSNGRVANYEIYGSNDNKSSWTLLKSGTLTNQATEQTVSFDQTMECDYIKFVMLSEQASAFYASMAEFNLFTAASCGTVTSASAPNVQVGLYPTLIAGGGQLTIQADSKIGKVQIFNLQGQMVYQTNELSSTQAEIMLPGLITGQYLVHVTTQAGIKTQKITVR